VSECALRDANLNVESVKNGERKFEFFFFRVSKSAATKKEDQQQEQKEIRLIRTDLILF
jgi:hypothetical protein